MIRTVGLAVVGLLWIAACADSGGDEPFGTVSTEPSAPVASAAPEADGDERPGDERAAGCPEPPEPTAADDDTFRERRLEMVTEQIEARGIDDPMVLEAMRSVPRHEFVPDDLVNLAYNDHPLPIGHGQTISQPQIVALMTELARVEPCDRVLEIGTGSGYQAAVLAQMGVEVYTIEIVPELAETAADTLSALGYPIEAIQADGYNGWEERAPFDAIIVTAAPDHVPQPLVNQLAPDGRMVIPVGPVGAVQTMWRFTLDADGELIGENFGPVRFVPFTRSEE